MSDATIESSRSFLILRDGDAEPTPIDWSTGAEGVRHAIAEAMNAKNIAFLLGAGCSSLVREGAELGVSTMGPLAKEFCGETLAAKMAGFYDASGGSNELSVSTPILIDDQTTDGESTTVPAPWRLTAEEIACLDAIGIDLEEGYNQNLERLMEVLFAQRFVLQRSTNSAHWPQRDVINAIIRKVQGFLWSRLTEGAFSRDDNTVCGLYERFYRKLVLRDRSLPRPWVFTTNYDVFNETAMDRLGIPYANGFIGVVERRFNPATFRYALAEQLDVRTRKWAAVDAFVYLCKLHGSVTWTEDSHGLFPIREVWPPGESSRMLIYPTPAKQNSSLGSPYADLFREFQSRIVRDQTVLITAGYAFGDEHLNNIIYQALTIPTFRLIVFVSPETEGEIAKLRALRDPRIWIIGGDGPQAGSRAHYFDVIVEHFMPQRPTEQINEAVRNVLKFMAPPPGEDEE
jgi:hypothetical protein